MKTQISPHSLVPATFVLCLLLACHVVAVPTPRPYAPAIGPSLTLLNDVGKLNRTVSADEIARWKRQLHRGSLSAGKAARLHLLLGEVEIARNKAPERALWHFRQAQRLTHRRDRVYGCAAYDRAVTLFFQGAYPLAASAFHDLIIPKTALNGYSRLSSALWYRHAGACAGYHAQHEKLGITEPRRLDPHCGIAALAACLQANGRPYDKQTLLANCRMTGLGNSMQDLLDGAKRMGMSVRCVKAGDEGMKLLPKPLVAYVELDHFVAVTRADETGVSYLCSDCGAWPGGRRDLSWKQWRVMDCNLYLVVAKPGSAEDHALRLLGPHESSRRLAAAPSPGPRLVSDHRSGELIQRAWITRLLSAHIVLYVPPTISCGQQPVSPKCPPDTNCPVDPDPGPDPCPGGGGGPSGGDPVDLATGEEEYSPETDLTVYNPIGPNVVWQRHYGSMRGPYTVQNGLFPYPQFAYGNGWTNDYDQQVIFANGVASLTLPNGSAYAFTVPATPTASNPQVACPAVNGGVPMLCAYNYNSDGSFSFVFTTTNRSQWVFSSLKGYALSQMADRNGNFINFLYTTPGSSAGYELSEITDSNNRPLLTIRHNAHFNIVSVADRYSRSVTYQVQRLANIGVPIGYPQFSDELVQVSQIVRTGTLDPASRFRYGYEHITNGDSGEQMPALHTITVPSPTGRGVSTATIDYDGFYVGSRTDGNGNTTTYTQLDGNDTQVTIADSKRNVVYSYTVSFDAQMRTGSRTDGTNQTVVYQAGYLPDNAYQPATVTDGNNQTTTYAYDQYGQVTSRTSPRNVTTTYTFNYTVFALGERTQAQEGAKTPISLIYYEPAGQAKTLMLPAPGTTSGAATVTEATTYDALGNVLTIQTPGNDSASVITTTFNYTRDGSYSQAEALGQPLTTTDNLGHVTHYRYDARGNCITEIDAIGNETDTVYNLANQRTRTFAPAIGDITNLLRVTRSALKQAGGPNAYTGTLTLTNTGTQSLSGSLLIALTNLAPGVTLANASGTYVNSPCLLTPSVSLSAGVQTSVNVSFAAPSANAVNYGVQTYLTDNTGNPTVLPSETRSIYLYPGGPLISVATYDETGALYRKVGYGYGKEGERLSVTGSAEPVTYTYDAVYRRQTLTGGNGNKTRYSYNAAGWLADITYPQGDHLQYPAYDPMGHVLKRIDGRGIETDYTYNDPESKLTNVAYINNASYPNVSQYNVGIDYDGYGRRQDLYDFSGHTHFDHDDLNQQTEIDTTYNDASGHPMPTVSLTYGFNPDGTRQEMNLQTATTIYSFVYGYDGAGRPRSVTNPFNEITQWSYLDNNWLAAQQDANGVQCLYAYNRRGFINDLTHYASNGSQLSDFGAMVYDASGNRLTRSATIPGAPSPYSGQTGYTYDSKNELTQEQSTLLGGYAENFNYDPADNPTVFRGVLHGYNSDNQVADAGFTYDGNGNPDTYAGASLGFDPENRMTSFGTTLTAGYRADGLRAWKQTGSGRTYFIYDLLMPVLELDGAGNVLVINTVGANGLISRNTGAGSTFLDFDPQGSAAQRLDASGNPLATSAYDAFGTTKSGGSNSDPAGSGAQFGYYTDVETGLQLLEHRYYDPGTGRFLTRDPIQYQGGINLYDFALNDPVNLLDLSGENPSWTGAFWARVLAAIMQANDGWNGPGPPPDPTQPTMPNPPLNPPDPPVPGPSPGPPPPPRPPTPPGSPPDPEVPVLPPPESPCFLILLIGDPLCFPGVSPTPGHYCPQNGA